MNNKTLSWIAAIGILVCYSGVALAADIREHSARKVDTFSFDRVSKDNLEAVRFLKKHQASTRKAKNSFGIGE